MKKRESFWSRHSGERPKIFAHRGGVGQAYENTITAYTQSAEAGVDGVEIDVSYTADKKLICFHDATLKRISGNKQSVRDTSFRMLRSIPLEGNERIPNLEEAFDSLPSSIALILDIKTSGITDTEMIDSLLKFLKKYSFEEQRKITLTSFNYMALKYLAGKAPDLRTGFILRPDSFHTRLGMVRLFSKEYRAVHPQAGMISRKLVNAWHEEGFDVIPWTVNERVEAIKLAADGVDGIITDYAMTIRDALL
jgi:glycerophosphoryl diester phosphodiesterase